MTRQAPASLCIMRLSAIGDTCNLVPVVRTLQRAWPDTRLTWIIGATEHRLLGGIDGVEFITFDKKAGSTAKRELKRALRGRRFDVLLHMHASMRANLLTRFIKADRRIGFDRARARDFQWLFTNERIEARPSSHVLDGFFQFAETLGIGDRAMSWDIPLPDDDMAFARQIVDTPTLLISPCSSTRWRNFRNWRADNYARVADYAAGRYNLKIVLTGGPTDMERDYARRIREKARTPVVDLIGETSLTQLLALIGEAQVLISPDSGPAHMATAAGTPVLGLYATSNRWRTGPYLSQDWVVDRYPDAVSRALGKRVADLPWGYRVRTPYAMDLITVEDVTAKLDALMQGGGSPSSASPH